MSDEIPDLRFNERDDREWRIPRKGTLSNKIYHLLRQNKTTAQVADILDTNIHVVRVLAHRIKHPKVHNATALRSYHRVREKKAR